MTISRNSTEETSSANHLQPLNHLEVSKVKQTSIDDKTNEVSKHTLEHKETENGAPEQLNDRVNVSHSPEPKIEEVVKNRLLTRKGTTRELVASKTQLSLSLPLQFEATKLQDGGRKLADQSKEILKEFNMCSTDNEKKAFIDTHKEEINQLKDKVQDFNSKLKTIENNPASNIETSALIRNCTKIVADASVNLEKIKETQTSNVKLDDSKTCVEFLPTIRKFENHTQNIEIRSRDLLMSAQNASDEDKQKLTNKLGQDIEDCISRFEKIEITYKGDAVLPKDLAKLMDELTEQMKTDKTKSFKSQIQLLEVTQATLRHIGAAGGNIKLVENEKYKQLTEENFKTTAELKTTLSDLVDKGESNDSILKNKKVKSLKIAQTEGINKLLINGTKSRVKYMEETFGFKTTTDPLAIIKTSGVYVSVEDALKFHLKNDLKKNLETKLENLVDGDTTTIENLKSRIKELK